LTAPPPEELATVWRATREDLRRSVIESTFALWLEPLEPAALRGTTLYLTAPPNATAWVERRYAPMIAVAASRHCPQIASVALLPAGEEPPVPEAGGPTAPEMLNPEHTFDRFVIGAGTRLAHAAALAVAESPSEAYNPLFLHGPPGLGKTHLLGAIANYAAANHPSLTVRYTTAERFTSDFVGAVRGGEATAATAAFKQRHRDVDVLLIDDVQFLAGKERTAEEFFHTFNILHEGGRQIVLSSDRPPADLEPLAERLRQRFEWGMLAELDPPDFVTRQVILRRLAREADLPPETAEAIDSIAASDSSSVRRLQGALTRLVAQASVQGRAPDAELAATVIGSRLPDSGDLTAAEIKNRVAARLGVSESQLDGAGRSPNVVRARHLAIYLCRRLTDLSLPQIGAAFGRNHSTVLHSIRKIENEADLDDKLAAAIHSLTAELRGTAPNQIDDRAHCENRQPSHSASPQADTAFRSHSHSNPQDQSHSDLSDGDL
jgi:chromosomal replication initiator protein